ncbi:MAG: hypothetical protein AAGG68_23520 [Bacteroidota bacterium]
MCSTEKQKERVERIINREIYANQSSLVFEVLLNEHDLYGEIENQYDESLSRIEEYLIHEAEIEEQSIAELDEQERRELAYEKGFSPEPHKIYEWHLISNWLANKLRLSDEPILDTNYGTWWGRTCTGQAISLDGIIQQIVSTLK